MGRPVFLAFWAFFGAEPGEDGGIRGFWLVWLVLCGGGMEWRNGNVVFDGVCVCGCVCVGTLEGFWILGSLGVASERAGAVLLENFFDF